MNIPEGFLDSCTFFFVLLNPFLMSLYLLDLIKDLSFRKFITVLTRAAFISFVIFSIFAISGEQAFQSAFGARFEAFLIFGGVIFFVLGIRFVFEGVDAIRSMRGPAELIEGSIAMPFIVGPGTISASVLAGSVMPAVWAVITIAFSLFLLVISMGVLKMVHDVVQFKNTPLVEKYIEIVGRVSAIIIGTIAVEMMIRGFEGIISKVA
jgi:small neutral amino acid transporter SnatA (MarC family)